MEVVRGVQNVVREEGLSVVFSDSSGRLGHGQSRVDGAPFDPALVRQGDFHHEAGYFAGLELLRGPDRPTAVFTGNDLQALGLLFFRRPANWACGSPRT